MRRDARASSAEFTEGNGNSRGPASRALLVVATAVLVLFAATAQASAAGTITIEGAGTGTGTITAEGGDPLNCHIVAGVANGDCTTFAENPIFEEIAFNATPEGGSSFTEWELTGEFFAASCEAGAETTHSPCVAEFKESQSATLKAGFAAPPPTPTVTAVSPGRGPTAGGEAVTITGTDLSGATKIAFGTIEVACADTVATCKVESATEIKATTPAHAAGAFDVMVTTAGGASVANSADKYAYVAPPAVTAVSPTKGSSAGGNTVVISGLRLAEATQVEFGTTVVSAPFIENSATTIEVKAPAHAPGAVDVRVTTVGGTSGEFFQDEYAYVGPPVLTLAKAGTGAGSISCDGSACAPTYPFGTLVTLAATPAPGSAFAGWSGGGCSGGGPCTVRLEADATVTAAFEANSPPPGPPPALTRPTTPKPLKCKKGFKKKKARGKAKCMKIKTHRRGSK